MTPSPEIFAATKAMFAMRGHVLTRSYRREDGKQNFLVCKWTHSRSFSEWNDVLTFLRQIGGSNE